MNKLFLLIALLPSLASSNVLEGPDCAKNGRCRNWILESSSGKRNAVCLISDFEPEKLSVAKILPTEKEFTLKLSISRSDLAKPAAASKAVIMRECGKAPLLDVIFDYKRRSLSPPGAEDEYGVLSDLMILSQYHDRSRVRKCDQAFSDQMELDFLNGRLDQEAARIYFYHAKGNQLDLVFQDTEICKTNSGLVKLSFTAEH